MADQPSPHFTQDINSLLSLRPRADLLTGIFRDVLAKHFQPGNIQEPSLRELIWSDSNATAILIESSTHWKPQTSGKLPAIVVKRNTYSNRRVGIADRRQVGTNGVQRFSTYWTGSHTLFCLSRSGLEASLLAYEVARELTEFGPELLRELGLERFQVMECGPVSEIVELEEVFAVPVTVGYVYTQDWEITKQAPRLRRISLSMLLQA